MGTIILILAGLQLLAGVGGFIHDRRRLRNIVFTLFGLGFALIGLVLYNDDGRGLSGPALFVLGLLIVVPLLGYPILTLFLLANGLTMWRRERRTPANLLSLLLGLVLVALPIAVVVVQRNVPGETASVLTTGLFGITLYFGFCFFALLLASLAYRKIPTKLHGEYVIVLGSGLHGTQVPPLLAARLAKAIEVADAQDPPAVIIPSGGKGSGEQISEAEGMARYLRDHGIAESRIRKEDQARTTEQNLIYSRRLLPAPDAHVIVATNSYHVFRAAMLTRELGMDAQVVSSKTARYYLPSAFLREFAAVMAQFAGLNMVLLSAWTAMVIALLFVT